VEEECPEPVIKDETDGKSEDEPHKEEEQIDSTKESQMVIATQEQVEEEPE
jgi:hypothetical protein